MATIVTGLGDITSTATEAVAKNELLNFVGGSSFFGAYSAHSNPAVHNPVAAYAAGHNAEFDARAQAREAAGRLGYLEQFDIAFNNAIGGMTGQLTPTKSPLVVKDTTKGPAITG